MSRFKLIIIIGLLLSGFGLSGALLYGNIRLKKELSLALDTMDELKKKQEGVYKKYQEKSALSSQLSRTKSSVEAAAARAREDAKKLALEKDNIIAESAGLKSDIDEKIKRIESGEAEVRDLTEKMEVLVKQKKAVEEKSLSDLAELEKKLNVLGIEKRDMQQELQAAKRDLDQARTQNAELCILAQEILKGYENKGPFTSLLEKEPFTRVKKVELEKFVQEYQDKIDKHKQTK